MGARALRQVSWCGQTASRSKVVVWSNQLILPEILLLRYLQQAVIVWARHDDINVVVPWYDAVVADSTDGCPCTAIVVQAVTLTDGYELAEYAEDSGVPALLYILYLHE